MPLDNDIFDGEAVVIDRRPLQQVTVMHSRNVTMSATIPARTYGVSVDMGGGRFMVFARTCEIPDSVGELLGEIERDQQAAWRKRKIQTAKDRAKSYGNMRHQRFNKRLISRMMAERVNRREY
ncbi:MAG: hypothetical protein EYC62_05685 [Alphaproteobacteria bacterium]|nr:MAG: hypothetical protein EYC62_05685 [Alphaproteobacteria bacterium]